MARHLVSKHEGSIEHEMPSSPMTNFPSRPASVADKVSLVFCMTPALPLRLVDDPFFTQAFWSPIWTQWNANSYPWDVRRFVGNSIALAPPQHPFFLDLQGKVKCAISGSVVALALDGWTRWNYEKVLNFVVLWQDKAIFWNTIPASYGESAKNVFSLTQQAVQQIESK